jgi:hypothetical protein
MFNNQQNQTQNIRLELSIEETNLILEALGQLPFARVYQTIGRIQEQARSQMQPPLPEKQDEK